MPLPWSPAINLPIHANYYQPSVFIISSITRGTSTTVTATSDLNYVVGQNVRITMPLMNGMRQINNRESYVLSVPTTTSVVLDIDSSLFDPFITTTSGTPPQIKATGDINQGAINAVPSAETTYVLGSFINIS